jgi:hypothetical protein
MTSTSAAPFRHVYHLNPWRLWPLPILCGLLLGLFFLLGVTSSAGSEDRRVYLTLAMVLTLLFSPFAALLWQSRLVLTAQGIAHHQFGYTVRSSWQNLSTLSLQRGAEALYLTQPGTKSALLELASRGVDAAMPGAEGVFGDPRALGQGRLIYLKPFMWHYRRGPLCEDLLRCAPHLVVDKSA